MDNLNIKENKVYNKFIMFVIAALGFLMLFIVNASYNELNAYGAYFGISDIIFIGISLLLVLGVYILIKRRVSSKKILLLIVAIGLLLRMIYAFTINSIPISDFAIMFETAGDVLKGDFSNLWGTGYIARFPHITVPVMYFAAIRAIFPEPLLAIKFFSVIASSVNVILIYLISKELFKERWKAQVGAVITALFPPLILYTAIFTTENIAIPLYLLSIYLFIRAVKSGGKIRTLFFAAMCLSFGNLFRMVGQIILVAFILYIVISFSGDLKKKLISTVVVIVGFLIPLVSTSFALHYSGVIEYQLWKGREPAITNVVKGLNVEHSGRWNPEDAAIPEEYNFDYDKIEEVSKEKIWERLSTTPKGELFQFFVNKLTSQWSVGDFSGSYWAEHSISDEDIGIKFSKNGIWYGQLFFVILISLSYIGLLNLKKLKENPPVSLIYYIFCGYGLFYLVSENQARYAFVVCWIFIIMALVGLDLLHNIKLKRE